MQEEISFLGKKRNSKNISDGASENFQTVGKEKEVITHSIILFKKLANCSQKGESENEIRNDGTKKSKHLSTPQASKNYSINVKVSNPSQPKESTNTQTNLNNFFIRKSKNTNYDAIPIQTSNKVQETSAINSAISSSILLENKLTKIYSWNVNGYLAVTSKEALTDFIKKEDPDILCLNETKLDDKTSVLEQAKLSYLFPGIYHIYWNNCKTRGGYSGVSIMTKHNPLAITYGISDFKNDQEGRVITLEYESYFLVAVYVPNSGQKLKRLDYRVKEWDIAFANYTKGLKLCKDVVICGDLNVAHSEIDIFQPKGHNKYAGFTPEERKNFTKFLKDGYVDTFRHLHPNSRKYTFFSDRYGKRNLYENKGWRLDYFVVNSQAVDRVIDSDILNEYDASDHSPIKLIWKI